MSEEDLNKEELDRLTAELSELNESMS